MALLTDGNPNGTESLRLYETEILSVANVEGIDLNGKLGLATAEVSDEVINILLDQTRSMGGLENKRRATGVSDVVVTRQLKRWHAVHTLATVYRDAFNNQLNDRYQAKWNEYRILTRMARDQTTHYGLGLVAQPIPRAVAPTFSSSPGSTPATIYYVQVSWVSTNGQEGTPSLVTAYQTDEGSSLVVQAVSTPTNATSWNIFIGLTEQTVTRQNVAPIAMGDAFTLPPTGLVMGAAPGDGQPPETFVTGGRILRRG